MRRLAKSSRCFWPTEIPGAIDRTPRQFREELWLRGAHHVDEVRRVFVDAEPHWRFQDGVLLVSQYLLTAPAWVVNLLAAVLEPELPTWMGLHAYPRITVEHALEIARLRARPPKGIVVRTTRERVCAGTPDQQAWLRDAYAALNAMRFGGRLPTSVPLRWAATMRSCLGSCSIRENMTGGRFIGDIALSLDLLLPDNAAVLEEVLLHEMAHAATWLFDGRRGHGPVWKRRAQEAGCPPHRLFKGAVRRRARGAAVLDVPPMIAPPVMDAPMDRAEPVREGSVPQSLKEREERHQPGGLNHSQGHARGKTRDGRKRERE